MTDKEMDKQKIKLGSNYKLLWSRIKQTNRDFANET